MNANEMMNISPHITYKESIRSNSAKRHGIDNIPNSNEQAKMRQVAEIFEVARLGLGGHKIYISSFFRSEALNQKVGGSPTSSHRKGEAIDADCDVYGVVTNKQLFDYIRENCEFDQLIWEFGDDLNPDWVHLSYREGNNRNQVVQAYKNDQGKTKFRGI